MLPETFLRLFCFFHKTAKFNTYKNPLVYNVLKRFIRLWQKGFTMTLKSFDVEKSQVLFFASIRRSHTGLTEESL